MYLSVSFSNTTAPALLSSKKLFSGSLYRSWNSGWKVQYDVLNIYDIVISSILISQPFSLIVITYLYSMLLEPKWPISFKINSMIFTLHNIQKILFLFSIWNSWFMKRETCMTIAFISCIHNSIEQHARK